MKRLATPQVIISMIYWKTLELTERVVSTNTRERNRFK